MSRRDSKKRSAPRPKADALPHESRTNTDAVEASREPGPAPTSTKRAWLDDALVLLAAVLTFAGGISNDLVRGWDDGRFLDDFAPVQSVSVENLVEIFRQPHFEAYHPLHLLSYWLDVPFAGPHGPSVHATSLALFAGALLLVRRVFEGLGLGRLAALLATFAYGLHPAQVEAVSWATGRKEIVALLFASGAILLHLRSFSSVRSSNGEPTHASPWGAAAWGSRVLYVLAALAKTTVLPLPLVLVLIDVFLRRDDRDETSGARWRRAFLAQLPTLAIGGGLAVLVLSIWETSEMVRPSLEGFGPIALVASTITHHLGHVLAPFGSSPVYPIHRDPSAFGALDFVGPVALLLALFVPSPRARFSILAFVVLLLPVSNVVPLYFEVQDRYLALPLLPLAFGLGAFVDGSRSASTTSTSTSFRAAPSRVVLALAYVALLATLTYRYTTVWANDGTLWRHATRAQPEADYAWIKLGETLRDEALTLEGNEARLTFDRSVHAYDRAIRIAPTLVLPHVARLRAMAHRDELVHSIAPSRAAELATRFGHAQASPDALKELASDMLDLGYHEAALVPLGRALDLDPLSPERLEHAARVQLESGHEWLARFYVSRLPSPPIDPVLSPLR